MWYYIIGGNMKTKYPIILVHGIIVKELKFFKAFGKIEKTLKDEGFSVYTSLTDGFGSISNNANQLKKQILKILEEEKVTKVNLIGHSKGGLDCKYLIKQYPNKKVNILMGDIKSAERETIRKNIEYEEGTIIIGTYAVCSTGLNIPRLHVVILYANSKSRIKVLQSIGRGLRKHNSKNKVIIYDIIDDLSYKTRTGKIKKNYCMQHYDERLSYYTEQQFPVINLVKNI